LLVLRGGNCDADDRRARYRDINDDCGGVVLTIKKYIYNNQQAGLLALALGGPPVWVRSMGGGSLVWRAVVFVGRAAHRNGKVGDLRDVGRDGGIHQKPKISYS